MSLRIMVPMMRIGGLPIAGKRLKKPSPQGMVKYHHSGHVKGFTQEGVFDFRHTRLAGFMLAWIQSGRGNCLSGILKAIW